MQMPFHKSKRPQHLLCAAVCHPTIFLGTVFMQTALPSQCHCAGYSHPITYSELLMTHRNYVLSQSWSLPYVRLCSYVTSLRSLGLHYYQITLTSPHIFRFLLSIFCKGCRSFLRQPVNCINRFGPYCFSVPPNRGIYSPAMHLASLEFHLSVDLTEVPPIAPTAHGSASAARSTMRTQVSLSALSSPSTQLRCDAREL